MKLRTALLAATMLAAPLVASPIVAQADEPISGLYVSLGAGVNLKQDRDIKSSSPAGVGGANLQSHLGPAIVAAVGYGLGNGFRAEIEGNYYNNQFYKVGGSSGLMHAGGHEQLYGVMVNGYYDFNNVIPMITPYVGIGIGYERANAQNVKAYGPAGQFTTDQTKGGFAAQAILGAAMPISAVPGLALTAEYRFMAVVHDSNYGGTFTSAAGVATPASMKLGNDYNHTFLIGVRYAFGAPPPAPPPAAPAAVAAPAPAPARSYLVFFDWDKATLTGRAREIIHEAAANSTHVQYTQIEVNGYTDTSGSAKYNMGLSIRRANAVAAELVRDGVPKNAIAIQGFGETHLLVPTGPNVREPQNRRVEIIIK
ncbi:MAG: OmpA family protein [Rhodospirillales bacterium]|nr:OmpA family protein [Rhodospirillales bacterium]